MRRIAALLCTAIAGLALASTAAAHADGGTDFSVSNVGDVSFVAVGQTVQGVIAIDYSGPQAPATLTLTFPAGLALGRGGVYLSGGDGARLQCTSAATTATCAVPAGTRNPYFVDITATTNATLGRTDGVQVDIEPVAGTDPNPDNNTATIPVTVIPTARLSFDLVAPAIGYHTTTYGSAHVPAGQQVKFTCTVTSHGPDAVTDLQIRIDSETNAPDRWALRLSPNGKPISHSTDVPIGNLSPGQSAKVDFYVTGANTTDTDLVGCAVDADPTQNLVEPPFDRAGDVGAVALLTVGSGPTTSPSPTAPSSSSGLASTGVDSTGLGGLAALLLVTGAFALYLGRRRRSGQHTG